MNIATKTTDSEGGSRRWREELEHRLDDRGDALARLRARRQPSRRVMPEKIQQAAASARASDSQLRRSRSTNGTGAILPGRFALRPRALL